MFTRDHFNSLVHYNELYGNLYFVVGSNRIIFRNYVGVIQVGNLTIEILPKADKISESTIEKQKWQGVLIDMLRQSGSIRLESMSDAKLRLKSASLLDIYFESFLSEVEDLVHQGLIRRYCQVSGNCFSLKGRIVFPRHLAENMINRERFFTSQMFYDRNNKFNQILRVALDVLERMSTNHYLVTHAHSLATYFEDIVRVEITRSTFENLVYARNTESYRKAIQFARLIILNYSPDVQYGRNNVLAILFDMNLLFERFIYGQLKREEAKQDEHLITFKAQVSRQFWSAAGMQKMIRPDIIANIGTGGNKQKVIIDTKWKIPGNGRPNDADLRQIYTYNVQFGASRGLLVYPRIASMTDVQGTFVQGKAIQPSFNNGCSMIFLELLNGDKLRRELGKDIITILLNSLN